MRLTYVRQVTCVHLSMRTHSRGEYVQSPLYLGHDPHSRDVSTPVP